jgi:S1-C subfamily serine protease
VDQASVLNLATNRASAAELLPVADYLFFVESAQFKEQGKIGVVLQEKPGSDGPIMEILEVNPQSNADEAGIRKDDILIFIDELAIHSMDDVRLALLDKAVGETVRISVMRGGETTGEQVEMEVELFNPSLPAGHP